MDEERKREIIERLNQIHDLIVIIKDRSGYCDFKRIDELDDEREKLVRELEILGYES